MSNIHRVRFYEKPSLSETLASPIYQETYEDIWDDTSPQGVLKHQITGAINSAHNMIYDPEVTGHSLFSFSTEDYDSYVASFVDEGFTELPTQAEGIPIGTVLGVSNSEDSTVYAEVARYYPEEANDRLTRVLLAILPTDAQQAIEARFGPK